MRFLAKVTMPLENAGKASHGEALPRAVQTAMERLKPEAAYIFEEDGKRECVFVFNVDIPSMLKPIFQNLDASIHVTPVLNAAEFEQRLGGERSKLRVEEESEFLADIRPMSSAAPASSPTPGVWAVDSRGLARDDERRDKKS